MKVEVVYVTHPVFAEHYTGSLHPERTARLRAVEAGVEASGLAVARLEAIPAEQPWLERVHSSAYLAAIERFCRSGGGHIDADTFVGPKSWDAALHAAGAGIVARHALENRSPGEAVAFVGVRPPGHHASADQAMGFCLLNNIAVTAAALRSDGHKVAIIDWDVHHGNGTEAMFLTDPGVLYLSLHQSPLYPFTGQATTVGHGEGEGTTINIPVPAGTAGDAYREASARIIEPVLTQFHPDWLLISAGYDAHAEDPLAELRLEAADYGWLAARFRSVAPLAPTIFFLEGGYHLPALVSSVAATLRGSAGTVPAVASSFVSPPEAFVALREAVAVTGRHWSL